MVPARVWEMQITASGIYNEQLLASSEKNALPCGKHACPGNGCSSKKLVIPLVRYHQGPLDKNHQTNKKKQI